MAGLHTEHQGRDRTGVIHPRKFVERNWLLDGIRIRYHFTTNNPCWLAVKPAEREEKMMQEFMNKKVVVRGDRSGVFFGTITAKEGKEVKLEDCRRLWFWDGASSISQIAVEGVKRIEDVSVWKR